jgi:hypothetical protein
MAAPVGGPTLAELYERYEARSARAGENVRFIAAAVIAVVWVLSGENIAGLATELLWTLALSVGALAFDFFQYVVAASMLGRLFDHHVSEGKKRQDFVTIPKGTNRPATVLYWIKIVLLVFSFVSLAINFTGRIGASQTKAAAAVHGGAAQPSALVCSEETALRRTDTP